MKIERTKWITDGEIHQELSDLAIYRNNCVDSFLLRDRAFVVVGTKGTGKTLLLRYKREILREKKIGACFIPDGQMLDHPILPHNIEFNKLRDKCRDARFWEDLWRISIIVSVLTHCEFDEDTNHFVADIFNPIKQMPHLIREFFNNKRYYNKRSIPLKPSETLSLILSESIGSIFRILAESSILLDVFRKHVNKPFYCFIDSFDQGLRERFQGASDIWRAGQVGLLSASWNLHRSNHHVKVYTTIRQEAYTAYHGENKMAMQGTVVQLSYTKADIKAMFNKLFSYYEGVYDFETYLGFSRIYNAYLQTNEDAFSFVYRHVVPIPRVISSIGNSISYHLSSLPKEDDIKKRKEAFRLTVINDASSIIKNYLIGEKLVFLSSLNSLDALYSLFSLVPSNILTKEKVDLIQNELIDKHVTLNAKSNPIAELINIGLIGYIAHNISTKDEFIKFKSPSEFRIEESSFVPPSDYYFIHPSLSELMLEANPNFVISKEIVVGDGLVWSNNQLTDDIESSDEIDRLILSIEKSKNETLSALDKAEQQRLKVLSLFKEIQG